MNRRLLLILGLITADLRYNSMEATRSLLDAVGAPIFWVADLPMRLRDWSRTNIQSRTEALEENERLLREMATSYRGLLDTRPLELRAPWDPDR